MTEPSKKLTSKETARLLGVSEASIKRWADNGLLPMIKTAGGHRRFNLEDIAVFQLKGFNVETDGGKVSKNRPHSSDSSPIDPNVIQISDEILEKLVNGNVEDVSEIFSKLFSQGQSIAQIADDVLCPTMRKIGDLWQKGSLTIAEEHIATTTGLTAIQRLRSVSDVSQTTGKLVICSSTEDDFHELPIQIIALILELKGWKIINLGASTPFYALGEAVEKFKPNLVCVSSTILYHLDRTAREFSGFRKTAQELNTSIALGGAGFSGEIRKRFDADFYADDFQKLETFATSLLT